MALQRQPNPKTTFKGQKYFPACVPHCELVLDQTLTVLAEPRLFNRE